MADAKPRKARRAALGTAALVLVWLFGVWPNSHTNTSAAAVVAESLAAGNGHDAGGGTRERWNVGTFQPSILPSYRLERHLAPAAAYGHHPRGLALPHPPRHRPRRDRGGGRRRPGKGAVEDERRPVAAR